MILSNSDLYVTVKAISEELQQAGEEQWSVALSDALSVSTIPGEVLGEIRLQLQRLRSSQASVKLDLN